MCSSNIAPDASHTRRQFSLRSVFLATMLVSGGLAVYIFFRDRPRVDMDAPAIIQATQRGDLDAVQLILADGPSALTVTDKYGNTAAGMAILCDHHEIAIYLIKQGYPINPQTDSDKPLFIACLSRFTEGSYNMLKYLLESGADPNTTVRSEGWVALNMAVSHGQEDKVRLLVEYGAQLDSTDRFGLTSLEFSQQQVANYKDSNYKIKHKKFDTLNARQIRIDRWQRMVDLLIELKNRGNLRSN